MNWWSEFANSIELDVSLGPKTWFRLGGRARFLCQPRDVSELQAMVVRARDEQLPIRVLGAGANVLVGDRGFQGVVVVLNQPAFTSVEWDGASVWAGAGVELMPFSRKCSYEGLSGLECMAGIPATVGGAVCMNAGGRFGDFGRVVREVDAMRLDGDVVRRSAPEMAFGYRKSSIKDEIVIGVRLCLEKCEPSKSRAEFDRIFSYKTASQPMADKSAGCIFKNPEGESAGALIDRAGLKGVRRGGASVSERHANFIVADANARAADVIQLIGHVQDCVRQKFGTDLETEIDIWDEEQSKRKSS